ncbi:MAG: hypothetical protein IJO45_01030 [Oscillospiraceae bacterium]|nr:hypothetical protein [Oscillospiraceae bacterium]
MAKKYEFRPDKPQVNLLSKLYITAIQRKNILKWFLYAMILLVLSLLQDVILCRFRLFGATTELVPCAIILICIMEGTEKGSLFALIGSLLYLFSGTAVGTYAMVLITALAIFACMFRQGYLRKGFSAAMLCTCMALFLYEMGVFGIGVFLGLTYPGRFVGFCVTAGLSMLAAPVLYPLVLRIGSIGGDIWKE